MHSPPGTTPSTAWILEERVAKAISRAARRLSRSPGFSQSDEQDIEQEFRVHLLRKAVKYNASRSKPSTFAARIIKNKAASMARKAAAQKRTFLRNGAPLNVRVFQDGRNVQFGDTLEAAYGRRHTGQRVRRESEQTQLRLDIAEANATLDPQLRRLAALVSHVPLFAAGQVLGMSRRQTARYRAELGSVYETRRIASMSAGQSVPHFAYVESIGHRNRGTIMDGHVFRYRFDQDLDIAEVEATFNLSLMSVESLHGESRVCLEARHAFDSASRTCAIDATGEVGRDLNQLFVGFINREFSRDHFRIECLAQFDMAVTTTAA